MVKPTDFNKQLPACPVDGAGAPNTEKLSRLGSKGIAGGPATEASLTEIDNEFDELTGDDDASFANVCEDAQGNVYYDWDSERRQTTRFALDAQGPDVAGTARFVDSVETLLGAQTLTGADNPEAILAELARLRATQEAGVQSEQQRRVSQLKGDILVATVRINQLETDLYSIPSALEYTKARIKEMKKSLGTLQRPSNQFLMEVLFSAFAFGAVVPFFKDIGHGALLLDQMMGKFGLGIHKIYKMICQDTILRSSACGGPVPATQMQLSKGALRHIVVLLAGTGVLLGGNELLNLVTGEDAPITTSAKKRPDVTGIPDLEPGERTAQEYEQYLLGILDGLQSKETALLSEVTPLRLQKAQMDSQFQSLNMELLRGLNPQDFADDPELQQLIIDIQEHDDFSWADRLIQNEFVEPVSHVASLGMGFGIGTEIGHGIYRPYVSLKYFRGIHRGMEKINYDLRMQLVQQCSTGRGAEKTKTEPSGEKALETETPTETETAPTTEPVPVPETAPSAEPTPAELAARSAFLNPADFVTIPLTELSPLPELRLPTFELPTLRPAYAMAGSGAYYASPATAAAPRTGMYFFEGNLSNYGSQPTANGLRSTAHSPRSTTARPRIESGALMAGLAGGYVLAEVSHTVFDTPEWARRTTDAAFMGTAVALTPPSTLVPSILPGTGGAMMFSEGAKALTHETELPEWAEAGIEAGAGVGGFFAGASVTAAATGYVCAELGVGVATLGGTLVGTGVGAVVGLSLLGGYALFRHYNQQEAFEDWRADWLGKTNEFFASPTNPNMALEIRKKFLAIENDLATLGSSVDNNIEFDKLKALYDELQREKSLPEDQQYTTIALAWMGEYMHLRYFKNMKVSSALGEKAQSAKNYLLDICFPGLAAMNQRFKNIFGSEINPRSFGDEQMRALTAVASNATPIEKLLFQQSGSYLIDTYIDPWLEESGYYDLDESSLTAEEIQTALGDASLDFEDRESLQNQLAGRKYGFNLRFMIEDFTDPLELAQEAAEQRAQHVATVARRERAADQDIKSQVRKRVEEVVASGNPAEIEGMALASGMSYADARLVTTTHDEAGLVDAIMEQALISGQFEKQTARTIPVPSAQDLESLNAYADEWFDRMSENYRSFFGGTADEFWTQGTEEICAFFAKVDSTYSNSAKRSDVWIKARVLHRCWAKIVETIIDKDPLDEQNLVIASELQTFEKRLDDLKKTGDSALLDSLDQSRQRLFILMGLIGTKLT